MKSLTQHLTCTMMTALAFGLLIVAPVDAAQLKVFLMGGQSNMKGEAAASGLPTTPVNLQQPQNDVLFSNAGANLIDLQPGSGNDFGPEVTFGRAIADAFPGETFALLKHAVSASSLHVSWDPDTGNAYSQFKTRIGNALGKITNAGDTYEIVGMLWTQGEKDASDDRTTAQYQADLDAFIADVRTNYGANLPFYLSRLSDSQTSISTARLEEIRQAQANVAAGDANTYLVDTDGFGVKADNLHFDAAGQIALGEAFADAYVATVPEPTSLAAGLVGLSLVIGRRRR